MKFVDEATITLQPGDGVVLYTDGITEAENMHMELYGLDRLCKVVSQTWETSADQIRKAIIEADKYIQEQHISTDAYFNF